MPRKKAGKVVGDMIDMRRVAAGELPVLAQHDAGAFGHHQHGGHAERMRHFEIAREILEDRGLRRIDVVAGEKALIDLRPRLRLELGRLDIEDVVEMLADFEPAHHRVGMVPRAVGEDEFAARAVRRWRRRARGWASAANDRSDARFRETRPAARPCSSIKPRMVVP